MPQSERKKVIGFKANDSILEFEELVHENSQKCQLVTNERCFSVQVICKSIQCLQTIEDFLFVNVLILSFDYRFLLAFAMSINRIDVVVNRDNYYR